MRKCPNCKKALPVGARRCVYCRMLLSDDNESAASDNNRNQFGVAGYDDFGAKKTSRDGSSIRTEELAHHTMIGLGPISSDPNADSDLNLGQRTIAGMPGISFASSKPSAGSYRMASHSYKSVAPAKTDDHNNHSIVANGANHISSPAEPVLKTPVVSAAPVPAPEPQENLLAGLPGVAPMPSSLVDEEFVDLTSKIFGVEFASADDDDEDEDGLDFDFTAPPQKIEPAPAQTAPVPENIPQPSGFRGPEPVPVTAAPAAQPAEISCKSAPTSQTNNAKPSAVDYSIMALAVLSALLGIAWCAVAGSAVAHLLPILFAVVVNVLLDILCVILRKKFSSAVMAVVFFVGALALIATIMMFLKNPAMVAVGIVGASLACQSLAAIFSFLKKS